MYMMFIYVDGVAYNTMGIRGELDELYAESERVSKIAFSQNPRCEISTKITKYI